MLKDGNKKWMERTTYGQLGFNVDLVQILPNPQYFKII